MSSPTGSFPRISITGNFLWGSLYCTNKEFLSLPPTLPVSPTPQTAEAVKAVVGKRGWGWIRLESSGGGGQGADGMGRNRRNKEVLWLPLALEMSGNCLLTGTRWLAFTPYLACVSPPPPSRLNWETPAWCECGVCWPIFTSEPVSSWVPRGTEMGNKTDHPSAW